MADIVDPTKRPITHAAMIEQSRGDLPFAPASSRGGLAHEHLVRFYEDPDGLAVAVADFLGNGARAGDVLIVIATKSHSDAFRARLEADGCSVGRLLETGQLTFLDARETLATFMRDGQPDPALFEAHVGGLIAKQASGSNVRLRAYGEMVDVLWADGQRTAALRLEELWNELQDRHPFTLLCAYSMASFYKEPSAMQSVSATHTHVIVASEQAGEHQLRATELPPPYARQLAQEIGRRSEIEQALRDSVRELRRKEEQLRESEEQLKDFIENAALGIHRVGPDGTILWANRSELELLGYSHDEYVGKPIGNFHADASVIDDILCRLERGEELHNYEARLRTKDGSIKHVLISSNVYSREGRFIHTRCFTRDITARKQAEDAVRGQQQQLQVITDALPVLVAQFDPEGRYRFVNAAYERWFGYAKGDVLGKGIEEVAGHEAYAVMEPHFKRVLAGHPTSYYADLRYRDGKPRSVHATYIPLFTGDTPDGFVALVKDETERRSFERYREAAAQRAERLLRITSAIANAVTADEVITAVVDQVASAVDASSAGLWLVDEENSTATLARGIGYSASTTKALQVLTLDCEPSVPAIDAIRRGEPVWITSQRELLERYPHLVTTVTPGMAYGVTCLPLVSRGRTLGTLGLTIPESSGWTEDEKSFLVLVGRYASQAIERLRLLETERRSRAAADAAAARTNVLNHTSRVFMDAAMDLDSRLAEIVRELGSVINGCAGIALIEPDGRFRTAAIYHPSPEAKAWLDSLAVAAPLQVGDGVSGGVARTGQSVLLTATDPVEIVAAAPPAYREFLEAHPTYAMMVAPLRVRGGRIIGTVTATRTRPGETYAPADLSLLEALAERAASAIENARLHQENLDARLSAEQLYRFAQASVSADNVEQVFSAGLEAIAQALGASRSAILLFDEQGEMRFRAWRGLSDGYRRAVEGHSPWSRDAVDPHPVLVPDVHADASLRAFADLFDDEHIGSLAFIPLVTRGRLIGKFMVYYDRAHEYSRAETDVALTIGNHLASVTSRFAAVAELERTLHYNELFAGVLAHDLRNPLGAMLTAAQLLLMRHEGEGDRVTKPLSHILISGERMSRMIEQLLDLTRARSGGGIEIQPRETNLADLCSHALSELELLFPERKIHRDVAGDQIGSWDEDRLTQIISNLVANAAQHAPRGTDIKVLLDGSATNEIVLEVHNEGTIAANLLPHLFDPFRGTRHRRGHTQGLGLGLFIVRELARAHGGTVDVVSADLVGTTFSVRLPRRARS